MQLLETIRNAWKIADLRKKIFFTFFVILIFRIGSFIPVPFIDSASLSAAMASTTSNTTTLFSYLSILTGGALEYGAIFAMGVTPYINASIIMQLLTVAIPPLERISKEGEEGQKKIAKYTRYATVILALIQGTVYYIYLRNSGGGYLTYGTGKGMFSQIFTCIIIILCFTAGSALMMWLGEQIDDKGIGNGISILLFAGIISRGPKAFASLWGNATAGQWVQVIILIIAFLAMIAFIVFMTAAERRIPVQYAKKVVGRKTYGGQNSFLPIQVNMAGVLPIIFASSILSIPSTIMAFIPDTTSNWFTKAMNLFTFEKPFYVVLYLILIIFFAYFYVTIQYNPVEMANNLRKNQGAIPGIRPGKPTSDFIQKIISRITLVGALFLGVMAVLPIIVGAAGGIAGVSLGGTSILIIVGVALDTVKSIESQMMMRYYKGFLD